MRLVFFCAFCFFYTLSSAQNNLQVGYQEFPTTVLGHASDANGNMYYTGYFKGELTINGTVLTQGQGLDDLFWVKTPPTGEVVKYKTFSSDRYDQTVADGLSMGDHGQMYFVSSHSGDVQFDQELVVAYAPSTGKFMNMVTCIDTAGQVKWVRRTNFHLLTVYSSGNLVHVLGRAYEAPFLAESTTLTSAVKRGGLIYLVYDTAGNLLTTKTIDPNNSDPIITFNRISSYSDGSLLFSFQFQGQSGFSVNGTPVSLPDRQAQYQILLKTDTSFTHFRAKVINPGSYQLREFPSDLAKTDSLYAMISYYDGTPDAIDGYEVPNNQNMLFVFDSTLTVRRAASLGSSAAALPGINRFGRRIFLRGIKAMNNALYFTGQYMGVNEMPIDAIPKRDSTLPVIGDVSGVIDLNGPSKSFVACTSMDLSGNRFAWLGDHTPYEFGDISPHFVHGANENRFVFLLNRDNTWNPWVVDTNLVILSGAMTKNADRPEVPLTVNFFPDGGKLLLSLASGRTALDQQENNSSNFVRQDLFFSCFNPDGSVRWYRRINTSVIQPTVRKMVMHNGKAWFLGSLVGGRNERNFLSVGNEVYNANWNTTLLCSLNPNGEVKVLNLPHSSYRDGIIQSFSFFKNGDLAVLVNSNYPISLPGLSGAGFYILRVNPANGSLIDARQISGSLYPEVSHMEVDAEDNLYISAFFSSFNQSAGSLYLYKPGGLVADGVSLPSYNTGVSQFGLIKMSWNKFHWLKRTGGKAGASSQTRTNLFLINNRPVITFRNVNSTQPLFWESGTIHTGLPSAYRLFASLDEEGNLVRARHLPLEGSSFVRKGTGETLYVSGAFNNPLQIDTIQIGYAGSLDGISLVLDSTLVAKRSFRTASSYYEANYDMDIFQDSVVALAYSAQTTPAITTSRVMVQAGDYEPNAYFTTLKLESPVTLPVRWTHFEAKKQEPGTVALTWQVEGQRSGDIFYIEHSTGNGVYRTIAQVNALTLRNKYSFVHFQPTLNATNYYRVRHAEPSGKFHYSPSRPVHFTSSAVFEITPNPAGNTVTVQTSKEQLSVSIYDQSGRSVWHSLIRAGSGNIDLSTLPKGVYVVVAQSKGVTVASTKLIKQ